MKSNEKNIKEDNYNIKNSVIFMIYAVVIGAIIGLIVWSFIKVMNISIEIIWDKIPSKFNIPLYTIVVCTLGGLIIGILKKYKGDYPESLEDVITKVKSSGKYQYHNMGTMTISAMLPLIFGGSVGPEAGLTGIIAGLCTWAGDKFKYIFREMKELTKIGISATLGIIFNSPMFGFIEPIESETEDTCIPKTSKLVLYFLSILGALAVFILLNNILPTASNEATFNNILIGKKELAWLLPLSLIGVIGGFIYFTFNKIISRVTTKIEKYIILRCTLAGLILGAIGTVLPYTMFSGEHQINEMITEWNQLGVGILLTTAIVKLFITNICTIMGYKGGHFFPTIFSGVCLGYAFSILTGTDPTFSVSVITSALVSSLIRKPLATVLLLMICFPISSIPIMLIAAIVGCTIKFPHFEK